VIRTCILDVYKAAWMRWERLFKCTDKGGSGFLARSSYVVDVGTHVAQYVAQVISTCKNIPGTWRRSSHLPPCGHPKSLPITVVHQRSTRLSIRENAYRDCTIPGLSYAFLVRHTITLFIWLWSGYGKGAKLLFHSTLTPVSEFLINQFLFNAY
jgi:hypothetical protein